MPATAAERHRALLLAGCWRADVGQFDRARQDYEAALANDTPADPEDVEIQAAARLRLAEVIAATARQRPYRIAARELADALALVDSARPRQHWSYLTETDLRIHLSRVPDREARSQQEWGALLAAATVVSLEPGWAALWLALADAATARDLYRVAEVAAERAHGIEPANEATRAVYVRGLVNCGKYRVALEQLGDVGEPGNPDFAWWQCNQGLIALRQDRVLDAVGCYAGLSIDPAWLWAWNTCIRALIIAGELDTARQASAELMRTGPGREDERAWLAQAAFDARLQGELGTAADLAQKLSAAAGPDDFRARYALAEARLLGGERVGWDAVARAITADPRPAALDVWEREELPVLAALASDRGVRLRPPADLTSAVRGLRAREHPHNPVAELRLAAERADCDEAGEAAVLIEAALPTPVPDHRPPRPSRSRRDGEPPLMELRLPPSWLADARLNLNGELREWAAGKGVKLSKAEDLEPGRYQLLVGGNVRVDDTVGPGRAATAAELLAGEHRLVALLTRPAVEVIAIACYQVMPPRAQIPVTVRQLARRSWELRGKPAGTDLADWEVGESAFHRFVAERAYFRWEVRGRPLFCDPVDDWLVAEREITVKGVVPGTVVDERLRSLIAYFNWLNRGRPHGSSLVDWPA